jgi:hypothetical protein
VPTRGAPAKDRGRHREREGGANIDSMSQGHGRAFKGRRRTAARLMRASTTGCIIATASMSARSRRSTCSEVVVVVMEVAVRVAAARAVEERVAVARKVVRAEGVLGSAPPRK